MSIYTRILKQKCVYWPPGPAGDYGKTTYGTAVEIDCRWLVIQKEFVTREGTTLISTDQVFVGQPIEPEGWLWKGELADVPDAGDPVASSAGKIKAYNELPSLNAKRFLRWAFLGAS